MEGFGYGGLLLGKLESRGSMSRAYLGSTETTCQERYKTS